MDLEKAKTIFHGNLMDLRDYVDETSPESISPSRLNTLRLLSWVPKISAGTLHFDLSLTAMAQLNSSTEYENLGNPKIEDGPKNVDLKTTEKAYRLFNNECFLKRSLRPDEYPILSNGQALVPLFVKDRLRNEAACMKYVKEKTSIPVPEVLDAYEENGTYFLWTEYIDGIEMSDLTVDERTQIIPQVRDIVADLQKLRSRRSGGPTGLLCPPYIVPSHQSSKWRHSSSSEEEYVFCHGDLAQHNILVNHATLEIAAIIDWEFGGFFPRSHEIPFFESSDRSGLQVKHERNRQVVSEIVEFWKLSKIC